MSARRTIAYQPALDGVRAVAVVFVLLFHAEVTGFDDGYLGVSVFFTLSGYLITSLLVGEHDATGRIALGDSIAFVRAPVPNIWWRGSREGQENPARHDVVHSAMSDVQARNDATIGEIGLDRWLSEEGLDQDRAVRPDGVHWDQSAARMIAEYLLGDQLLRIALR